MILQEDILQRQFGDACRSGDIEAVESLLGRGASINQADSYGRTSLYIACQQGKLAVVELFSEKGANINQARDDGATPLYIAFR